MIEFFIVLSFIISFLIIIIVTKEIIDGSKKEVAILKALGYGNIKSSSLVGESQIIMMLISALISIPISIAILKIFET
jgi:ABC-type antimicrobial peptide transport system permease subunit